jgi:CelD/BcsL family acetyltransferase involved in cellulose biosynthesis
MPATTALVCELAPLEAEWRELWQRSSRATPFDSPDWLVPWWRAFGTGTPLVATLRTNGGRLDGILAGYPSRDRTVRCIGAGVSDRLDALLADGLGTEEAGWLLACLAAGAPGDTRAIDLDGLAASSPLLGAIAPPGWIAERFPSGSCPTVSLPCQTNQRVDYYRRRLARMATLRVELADTASVAAATETLITLHGARWAVRGEAGVLADDQVARFHREAAARLCAAGLLRLVTLWVDDAAAAACYGFTAKGRAYYYLGGFAPAWARFNAGTVAIAHAIELADREHARAYDFLRGCEQYKYRWGATDRLIWQLRLSRSR